MQVQVPTLRPHTILLWSPSAAYTSSWRPHTLGNALLFLVPTFDPLVPLPRRRTSAGDLKLLHLARSPLAPYLTQCVFQIACCSTSGASVCVCVCVCVCVINGRSIYHYSVLTFGFLFSISWWLLMRNSSRVISCSEESLGAPASAELIRCWEGRERSLPSIFVFFSFNSNPSSTWEGEVWTMQDLSVDIWQSWSPGGGFSVHLEHLTPLPFWSSSFTSPMASRWNSPLLVPSWRTSSKEKVMAQAGYMFVCELTCLLRGRWQCLHAWLNQLVLL